MTCKNCGAHNSGENNFYGRCGSALAVRLEKRHTIAVEQIREKLGFVVYRSEPGIRWFGALRDIEMGEEITVNYNGPPDDHSPMWFQMAE